MHFCSNCGNMYYLTFASNTDENNEDSDMLIYYCRKCGNKDSELYKQKGNLCVSKTHLVSEKHDFKNIINEYTKYDPTLPRINNIDCPNAECQTNKKNEAGNIDQNVDKEIIYLRYDNNNMKFIYLCTTCDNVWNN